MYCGLVDGALDEEQQKGSDASPACLPNPDSGALVWADSFVGLPDFDRPRDPVPRGLRYAPRPRLDLFREVPPERDPGPPWKKIRARPVGVENLGSIPRPLLVPQKHRRRSGASW